MAVSRQALTAQCRAFPDQSRGSSYLYTARYLISTGPNPWQGDVIPRLQLSHAICHHILWIIQKDFWARVILGICDVCDASKIFLLCAWRMSILEYGIGWLEFGNGGSVLYQRRKYSSNPQDICVFFLPRVCLFCGHVSERRAWCILYAEGMATGWEFSLGRDGRAVAKAGAGVSFGTMMNMCNC